MNEYNTIFCPSNHLMFDQPCCPVCGWQRPPETIQGSLLWDPVIFPCGIGGPAPDSFSMPAVACGVAVFPLRSGELVGISQKDGRVLWQTKAAPELFPRQLHVNENRILAVIADNRPMDQAENGFIARIDPQTGKMEKMWEGYGFTMTEPVFTDSCIIVRTAHPKLVALDRKKMSSIIWEAPLKTYKPLAPLVAENLVLVWDGELTGKRKVLKAFNLQDGKLIWEEEIDDIDCCPVVMDQLFIYRTGKRLLSAIDIHSGKQLWRQEYAKIYSKPAVCNGNLYHIMRDNPDNQAAHYTLQCIDPATGNSKWKAPLGIRAQEILSQPDGSLLIGMGDTKIAICDSENGSVVWQYSFGEEKFERVQTHLVMQDGICWVGTYDGRIAAIQISKANQDLGDPEILLREENFEEAAAAFALKGELLKSADIYRKTLNQPLKALTIYRYTQNIEGQIEALLQLGDERSAAKLLEEDDQLLRAAKLYEKANQPRKAMEIYKKLGIEQEVLRLRKIVPVEFSDIEVLESEGRFAEAGDAAMQWGDYQKAVDLYKQAGTEYEEKLLEALVKLCDKEPEPWSLEELAGLARRLGRFAIQANALEKSENYGDAAKAYQYAAIQMEEMSPTKKEAIARYYENAHKLFKQEGMIEKKYQCWDKLMFYRKIPWIRIEGRAEKEFRELEYNTFLLSVKNVGYGRADEITIQIKGDNFEVNKYLIPEQIEHLAANEQTGIQLSIRPLKDQIGEDVRFVLEWNWKDQSDKGYTDKTTVPVIVRHKNDSKTSDQPVIIHAENYYAGAVQHGDIYEGSVQNGDNFSVNHHDRTDVTDYKNREKNSSAMMNKCPICHLPVEKDAKFCDVCGHQF